MSARVSVSPAGVCPLHRAELRSGLSPRCRPEVLHEGAPSQSTTPLSSPLHPRSLLSSAVGDTAQKQGALRPALSGSAALKANRVLWGLFVGFRSSVVFTPCCAAGSRLPSQSTVTVPMGHCPVLSRSGAWPLARFCVAPQLIIHFRAAFSL